MMFVTGPVGFYAVRFLLGMAEAGFFPGMILYLSFWFPARERARAVGFFMSAIAISYAIGAPISGGIMSVFGGVAGLRTGSGCSSIEADPGADRRRAVWRLLPDGPQDAGWLDDDERAWLAQRARGRGAGPAAPSATRSARCSRTAACWRSPPVLHDGRQRLRPVVLGRRDRRQDRRPERRRQGLRDRDPLRRGDRRHDRDPPLLGPHGRAQAPLRRVVRHRRGGVRGRARSSRRCWPS